MGSCLVQMSALSLGVWSPVVLQPSVAVSPREHNWPHSLWVGRMAYLSPHHSARCKPVSWHIELAVNILIQVHSAVQLHCISSSLKQCSGWLHMTQRNLVFASCVIGGVLSSGWNLIWLNSGENWKKPASSKKDCRNMTDEWVWSFCPAIGKKFKNS